MTSPLNNSGVGIDPNDIDTITVVLYDQFDPTIEVARTLNPPAISTTKQMNGPKCYNGNDGSICVYATGGTGQYGPRAQSSAENSSR